MASETNNPVVLRTVRREPAEPPNPPPQKGIAFECPTQTKCPHCKAVVSLTNATPLSYLTCQGCGEKVFVPGRVGGFLFYDRIGEGEMGAIYRATDESLFRDVAIKLVRGCLADDRESRERLRREACAAGKINHPRVAQVHALNFSNEQPYLVMELVNGEDFAQRLAREGRIDERAVLRMALDVSEGLSALNREGLIHGDIKPGNIVLDRDGNAKLVDFGLSGMTRRDSSGNFVGTPDYIAPELLRGAQDSHSSDLFSLGATLYHLLSGKLPFEGETPEQVLKARLVKPPIPLGKVARHITVPTQKLVMRMLEPFPVRRQPSSEVVAAEIRDALVRLDAQQLTAEPENLWRRLLERLHLHLRRWSLPESTRRAIMTCLLVLIAVVNFLVAVEQGSFEQLYALIRKGAAHLKAPPPGEAASDRAPEQGVVNPAETAALPSKRADFVRVVAPGPKLPPAPANSKPAPKSTPSDATFAWQNLNLGGEKTRGSTLRVGDTLILQGTGTDMWRGFDRYRFAWTKAVGSYAFSSQVRMIADNNGLAVSGLLVKGDDPSQGTSLFFGFLGTGELVLQIRRPNNQATLVKRSERAVQLPHFLQLVRNGKAFLANVSTDGQAWRTFATTELQLPDTNSVGFCVSSQDPDTLATAKFGCIFLSEPDLPDGPLTNKVPAGVPAPGDVRP